MDHATCNVIYVDRRARAERMAQRTGMSPSIAPGSIGSSYVDVDGEHPEVAQNLTALLSVFNQGSRLHLSQPATPPLISSTGFAGTGADQERRDGSCA